MDPTRRQTAHHRPREPVQWLVWQYAGPDKSQQRQAYKKEPRLRFRMVPNRFVAPACQKAGHEEPAKGHKERHIKSHPLPPSPSAQYVIHAVTKALPVPKTEPDNHANPHPNTEATSPALVKSAVSQSGSAVPVVKFPRLKAFQGYIVADGHGNPPLAECLAG